MAGLPSSLAIALWIVASCWLVACIAYLLDVKEGIVLPLVVLGIATGMVELWMRGKSR